MALSDAEVESLRFHLGYGNIGLGAYPSTPDGFLELFRDVVAPNLTGGVETTATTDIAAGAAVQVTPASMTGIVVHAKLVIDVADATELITVRSVTGTTFTAVFANDHPSTGYPIALLDGHSRLRLLLNQAEKAWQAMTEPSIGDTAGLKQLDKGDIEWFEGFQVLKDRLSHYRSICDELVKLVRVARVTGDDEDRSVETEVY